MRFIENEILERIGFDFYCGIANNIVKARAEMGWIQKKLAEQSGISSFERPVLMTYAFASASSYALSVSAIFSMS